MNDRVIVRRNEPNQNTWRSLMRNLIKLMLSRNIPPEIPLGTLHRK
jgi:hypothetical protein